MARSARKNAAAAFRVAIARSNELHTRYLDDPELFASYDRFTRWQVNYILPFFSDMLEQEGYADAVAFIVTDLCGVGVSDRDYDLERATPVITRSLPTHAMETAAAAVELNAAVLEINTAIWRGLMVDGVLPATITEADYCAASRSASSFERVLELVRLTVALGETLKTLVRVPLIGFLLRSMKLPAHAAGFGALQVFLETGFVTFREISDIDGFLVDLGAGLEQVFDHIYN